MTDYQKWIDRIDNLLQIQRDRYLDLISANFTRRELIELKMMIEVFEEGEQKMSEFINCEDAIEAMTTARDTHSIEMDGEDYISYDMAQNFLRELPFSTALDKLLEALNKAYTCPSILLDKEEALNDIMLAYKHFRDTQNCISDVIALPNVQPKAEQESKTGHWINLEEFEEGISRGCDYAGTQEVVHDTFLECLNELGCVGDWDEMSTIDLNGREIVVQDLVQRFYDKTAKNIVNYAKTCEVGE